ncbi:MAG TPA: DMT family transporter [Thermoplasmata archaeon]|nr:DMT family transporter [Thermoplasmata archaeon]
MSPAAPTGGHAPISGTGLGLALVFATALISGVSTFVNFYAVKGTNSDAFVTVRNVATALLLVPIAALASRRGGPALRGPDWGRLAIIGLVGGAIPFLLFFRGVEMATVAGGAATASFAYRSLFLIATVLGIAFLRERFHWRVTVAAVLLLGGNLLLLSLTSPLWTDGTAYVFAATVLWAVEYTISRRTLRDLPSTTVALGRMGLGAAFLMVYLLGSGQLGAVGALSGGQWTWVAISALLLTAFVTTWYAGLARVELGVAASILVLGFPVTWVLSVALQGSAFTVGQVAGAVVVAAGVAVVIGRSTWAALGRDLARRIRARADG